MSVYATNLHGHQVTFGERLTGHTVNQKGERSEFDIQGKEVFENGYPLDFLRAAANPHLASKGDEVTFFLGNPVKRPDGLLTNYRLDFIRGEQGVTVEFLFQLFNTDTTESMILESFHYPYQDAIQPVKHDNKVDVDIPAGWY